jgi:hypothetical protein
MIEYYGATYNGFRNPTFIDEVTDGVVTRYYIISFSQWFSYSIGNSIETEIERNKSYSYKKISLGDMETFLMLKELEK